MEISNSQDQNMKFSEIFKDLQETMGETSVETIFIWALHLMNERDIEIVQKDDLDFEIIS